MAKLDFGEGVLIPANPARIFLREGEISEVTETGDVPCYCYLFNDMMIVASRKKHGRPSQRTVEQVITFDTCSPATQLNLNDGHHTVATTHTLARETRHRKRGHSRGGSEMEKDNVASAFGLTISGELHVLSTESIGETLGWLQAINKCIDEVQKKTEE